MPRGPRQSKADVTQTAHRAEPLTRRPQVKLPLDESTRAGPPEDEPRTRFATQQLMVAESVRSELGRKRYVPRPQAGSAAAWQREADRVGWVMRLTEPDSPSTDGGLKARLAILLEAEDGAAPALQCGWMDAAKMTSQLRNWEAVRRRHVARFGVEPPLDKQAYDNFLLDLRRCLLGHKLEVQLVVPDEGVLPPAPVSAPQGPGRSWVALAIGAAFLLGLVLGLLLHPRG
jgi:hypothetical protein